MVKAIYKITNNINNKVYIGQSKEPYKRWKQHKNLNGGARELTKAIEKYKEDNFSFEILCWTKNYGNKEKELIAKYDSTNPDKGYNISNGSDVVESKPIEVIEEIHKYICNTDLTYKEIGDIFEIPTQTIRSYSYGNRKIEGYKYPLRTYDFTKRTILQIKRDLYFTEIPLKELTKKYNISLPGLKHISKGSRNWDKFSDYPLRTKGIERKAKGIIYDLIHTELSFDDISFKYKSPKGRVYKINTGVNYKNNLLKYPLRDNQSCNKKTYKKLDK